MHLRDFTRHSLAAFVKGIQRPNLGVLVILLLATTLPHVSTFDFIASTFMLVFILMTALRSV